MFHPTTVGPLIASSYCSSSNRTGVVVDVTGMGSPTHATGIAGPTISPSHVVEGFDFLAPRLLRRVGAVAVVQTSRSTSVGLEREEGPLGCGPEEKRRSSRRRKDRWVRPGGGEEELEKAW
mmetsp:Transcript_30092/g.46241  ORF Transcript_30092/g.46241 Transcript_30092/m.46241 type:complete len:121 (+) Transcript_30092:78-440(+)